MPRKQSIPITPDNVNSLTKIRQLGHSSFDDLEWSPDGTTVAVASHTEIMLYDVSDFDEPPHKIAAHDDQIYAIAFHPSERQLASASFDRTVRFWNVTSGQCQQVFDRGKEWVNSLAFSPDGQTLATTTSLLGNIIHFWNLTTGEQHTWPHQNFDVVNCIAFSPDGKLLAMGCGYKHAGSVEVWDVVNESWLFTANSHTGPVEKVAFSADGSTIYSIGGWGDQSLRIWDTKSGKCLQYSEVDSQLMAESVSFNSDRSTLFYGQEDVRHSDIVSFDIAASRQIAAWSGHSDIVSRTAISPDDQQLVSGAWDGTLRWWNLETGHTRIIDENYSIGEITRLAFDRSGSVLAAKHADSERVRLWNVDTGKLLSVPVGQYFTDIDNHLLEKSSEGEISRETVSRLVGDSEVVRALSPDKTLLASGNTWGVVSLWGIPQESPDS